METSLETQRRRLVALLLWMVLDKASSTSMDSRQALDGLSACEGRNLVWRNQIHLANYLRRRLRKQRKHFGSDRSWFKTYYWFRRRRLNVWLQEEVVLGSFEAWGTGLHFMFRMRGSVLICANHRDELAAKRRCEGRPLEVWKSIKRAWSEEIESNWFHWTCEHYCGKVIRQSENAPWARPASLPLKKNWWDFL